MPLRAQIGRGILRAVLLGAVLLVGGTAPGPASTPSDGAGFIDRWAFTGAIDSGEAADSVGVAATSVHCSNFGVVSESVQVVLSNWNGAQYAGDVLSLFPGRTVTVSSHGTAVFFDDDTIDTPLINQGAGRIRTTSAAVLCTAMVVDPENPLPEYMSRLPIFDAPVLPTEIFQDGFESGSTSAWDQTTQ